MSDNDVQSRLERSDEQQSALFHRNMNVLDIMTSNPLTIPGDRSLRQALGIMHDNQIKHLPVLSKQSHLIGVLSDRDCRHALNSPFIMRERWQDEELAVRIQVRSVMTPAPIIVEPDAPADEAARLMLQHRIGCLPVMRAETLIGIVTRSDLLVAFMNIHRHYEAMVEMREQRMLENRVKQNGSND